MGRHGGRICLQGLMVGAWGQEGNPSKRCHKYVVGQGYGGRERND